MIPPIITSLSVPTNSRVLMFASRELALELIVALVEIYGADRD